ncbi:methenyltetrahydromethanopterin cyclohydrolase [Halococcoides cellulosivorans]|uniref:Methenyltetrahydromethanopterin cyclohydrolase n=1 Tax=Halococcoides cellulosivorans TaxID=1679096 RepID=A0A2R4WY91_9EURY|nr:methenyltetrahydromethanopterin cyclohydrolase [Halococcoides cellulosivorans]AWB26496.1 methenyltetrahydromethanopterin cyclohydrolase [Halococcoides cellulosivorans]
MDPLNRGATEIVDEAVEFADEYGIGVDRLDSGATVLDCGIEHRGGLEAGALVVDIQTGGLASVQTDLDGVAGATRPVVTVATDHPGLALLGSQKAGWEFTGDQEALGSGPARALAAAEDVFAHLAHDESFEMAVLCLETEERPTDAIASEVADRAGVAESAVTLVGFRTASLTGSVAAAARAAELGVYRWLEADGDLASLQSASGRAPVPPVAADERVAMARGTDAVAHGGQVHLTVDGEGPDPAALVSTAEAPFESIFDDADWAYADLDRDLFAPATVTVDVIGGPTRTAGECRPDVLDRAWH